MHDLVARVGNLLIYRGLFSLGLAAQGKQMGEGVRQARDPRKGSLET